MAPRRKKASSYHHGDLRQALLDAAIEAVKEGGFHALSLRDCARRAGVSHAAPYRHFEDKRALLDAIALEGFLMLGARGQAAMARYTDPEDRRDAYGVAYVVWAMEHPAHLRVMFSAPLEDPPEELQQAADFTFELLLGACAGVDQTGDPQVVALGRWAHVHGLASLCVDGRVPEELVDSLAKVEALAWGVLRPDGEPPQPDPPRGTP